MALDIQSRTRAVGALGASHRTARHGDRAGVDARLATVLADPAATAVVLDLAALDYISSAGIRSVVKTRKALEGRGGSLALLNLQPPVQKVFDIVKALPSGQIFGKLDRARRLPRHDAAPRPPRLTPPRAGPVRTASEGARPRIVGGAAGAHWTKVTLPRTRT